MLCSARVAWLSGLFKTHVRTTKYKAIIIERKFGRMWNGCGMDVGPRRGIYANLDEYIEIVLLM